MKASRFGFFARVISRVAHQMHELIEPAPIAAIDKERTLPDVLSFDPSKPAEYPNGRVLMIAAGEQRGARRRAKRPRGV
jgi:hypothetical protein